MKGRHRWLGAALVCAAIVPTTIHAATRTYYIAAENVTWNFAPSGEDLAHGGPIPEPFETVWEKTRYIEYTDASFTTQKPQPEWLGILGPIIRAEVGDTIKVNFLNRSDKPLGIHPHGVRYDKDNEGAHYLPHGAGALIEPGSSFIYTWKADSDSGPGPLDPSSIVWWYHSHVDEPRDVNSGLVGAIIITRKDMAKADGSPKNVDKEFVVDFQIFDEAAGEERGMIHSINGRIFGNLKGLEVNNGDRVRWHLIGMGNEVDLHTPHWHGKTVLTNRARTDVVELLPASMVTADMVADNPGTWMFHCHVADHLDAGMYTTYKINP